MSSQKYATEDNETPVTWDDLGIGAFLMMLVGLGFVLGHWMFPPDIHTTIKTVDDETYMSCSY